MEEFRIFVVPKDAEVRRSKNFAKLVADEVDDGLEIQLGGETLLDRIDDRKLGGALFGFLQQALRLVEEARVLERHAHGVAERGKQAHVRIRKRVRLLLAYADHAMGRIATQDGHVDVRIVHRASADVLGTQFRHSPIQVVDGMNDYWLPRPENMPCETSRRAWLGMEALAMIEKEYIANQIGFRIKQTDRDHVRYEYFADLVADQIVDGLHLQF